jgi:PPR repeat
MFLQIMSLYNTMREMDDAGAVPVLAQVGVGFYERVLSANARRGRWKEATYWMDEINRRGLAPSHKCYRLAIDACNKGGKAKEALKYIDAMLEAFADEGSIDDEAAPEGGEE